MKPEDQAMHITVSLSEDHVKNWDGVFGKRLTPIHL